MTRLSLGEEHQCEHCEVIIPPGDVAANVSLDTPHGDGASWLCGKCWEAWSRIVECAVAEAFAKFMRRRMPDPKKLEVLTSVGYHVAPSCGICANGHFRDGSDWGTCALFTYEHKKHGTRPLTINKAGACGPDEGGFKARRESLDDMARSGFDVFLEKKNA